MATKTDSVERSLEHELDSEMSHDTALATLSDRQENRLQMQEIKRRTIEPGLMQLSVKHVVSAENSENWAIDIEHPAMDDEIRVFAEKPLEGWTRDYKIVRVLDWYGIHDQDPHQLEFENVYMRKDEGASDYAHGWMLVEPPEYRYTAPMDVQIERTKQWIANQRPSRTNAKMWLLLLGGAVAGPMLASSIAPIPIVGSIPTALVTVTMFVFVTILGMAVMDNE